MVLGSLANLCPASSDLNAKGCVHQAFEMYRLKSCVDFKPYEGEKTFIKFEKRGGQVFHLLLCVPYRNV